MPAHELVTVLTEHWPEVLEVLSPDQLAFLADRMAAIEAAAGDTKTARAELASLTTMLAVWLPPDHPVSLVVSGGLRLVGQLPADPVAIAAALRSLPGLQYPLRMPGTGGGSTEASQAWLLATPALTEQEVHAAGADPGRPDLIRLPRADRRVVLPAFQFGQDGSPVPVVAEVNLLLGAAGDPWGVADWWLGQNLWLNGAPADLLGRVPDAELVRAAQAELPED
jgi:hypothetical protein